MDCAAEERLVRMAFAADARVLRVDVDLSKREVSAVHDDAAVDLIDLLGPLGPGAQVLDFTDSIEPVEAGVSSVQSGEVSTLRIAFAINAAMFLGIDWRSPCGFQRADC
jgi:hypothetical protein